MTTSQDLPGTKIQFAWDSTTLGYLKTCPRLYQYHLEGWQPPGENVHLRFGEEVHHAFQDYELSRAVGIRHNDAVHDVVRALLYRTANWWDDDTLGEMRGSAKAKTKGGLVRTVIWYLDKYEDDASKTYIREDGTPGVEWSFRFELDWGPQSKPEYKYVLCGHLDRVFELAGDLYVDDYKTTVFPPSSYFFEKFEPHNQMTLYSFAAKIVLDAPVKGVRISAIQVKKDGEEEVTNFGRGMTSRTEGQIKEWVADLHYWFTLAEQFALTGRWPMNDMACDMFGGCRFRDVCTKDPAVRQRFLEAGFTQLPEEERWNPLRSR